MELLGHTIKSGTQCIQKYTRKKNKTKHMYNINNFLLHKLIIVYQKLLVIYIQQSTLAIAL